MGAVYRHFLRRIFVYLYEPVMPLTSVWKYQMLMCQMYGNLAFSSTKTQTFPFFIEDSI